MAIILPQGIQLQSLQNNVMFGRPIKQTLPIPDAVGPRVISVVIPWLVYGASANSPVAINMNIASVNTSEALDAIRSVYIDNTFSEVPVYAFFPDTNFTVYCPPNSVSMTPVWTNTASKVILYAENFGDTTIPTTTFHFSNVTHAGFVINAGDAVVSGLTIGRILLVGGGAPGGYGLGGQTNGGGGGGGGVLETGSFNLPVGAFSVVVGTKGARSPGANGNGGNSTFNGNVIAGGGYGGSNTQPAGSAACGGGGAGNSVGAGGAGGIGSGGQNGGSGGSGGSGFGGSGGGGGFVIGGTGGAASAGGAGGVGGLGKASNISGASVIYGSGGGGGASGAANGGGTLDPNAGHGGSVTTNTTDAVANTGNGGGGGGGPNTITGGAIAGAGADGIVIIRYAGAAAATGGTITTVGTDTVHTFTANGVFTVL